MRTGLLSSLPSHRSHYELAEYRNSKRKFEVKTSGLEFEISVWI